MQKLWKGHKDSQRLQLASTASKSHQGMLKKIVSMIMHSMLKYTKLIHLKTYSECFFMCHAYSKARYKNLGSFDNVLHMQCILPKVDGSPLIFVSNLVDLK